MFTMAVNLCSSNLILYLKIFIISYVKRVRTSYFRRQSFKQLVGSLLLRRC